MTAKEIFEKDYESHKIMLEDSNVYEWAARYIFDLTTYDGGLDEFFVKIIVNVCEAILDHKTFELIEQSTEDYIDYILVCQLLNHKKWIEWGTSIRGAWFDYGKDAEPLFSGYGECPDVLFTEENLKTLIEFINEKAEEA